MTSSHKALCWQEGLRASWWSPGPPKCQFLLLESVQWGWLSLQLCNVSFPWFRACRGEG